MVNSVFLNERYLNYSNLGVSLKKNARVFTIPLYFSSLHTRTHLIKCGRRSTEGLQDEPEIKAASSKSKFSSPQFWPCDRLVSGGGRRAQKPSLPVSGAPHRPPVDLQRF